MKKAIAVLIVFMLILLSGCVRPPESDSSEKQDLNKNSIDNIGQLLYNYLLIIINVKEGCFLCY